MVAISPGTKDRFSSPRGPCSDAVTAPGSASSATAVRPVIVAGVPGNPIRVAPDQVGRGHGAAVGQQGADLGLLGHDVDDPAAGPQRDAQSGDPVDEDLFELVLLDEELVGCAQGIGLVLHERESAEMPFGPVLHQQSQQSADLVGARGALVGGESVEQLLLRSGQRSGQAAQAQRLAGAAVDPAQAQAAELTSGLVGRFQDERIGSGQPELTGQQQPDRPSTHNDDVRHDTLRTTA